MYFAEINLSVLLAVFINLTDRRNKYPYLLTGIETVKLLSLHVSIYFHFLTVHQSFNANLKDKRICPLKKFTFHLKLYLPTITKVMKHFR